MQKLAADEKARREASKQKNELEAYIIAFQGRLGEDEDLQAVTTEAQREGFRQSMTVSQTKLVLLTHRYVTYGCNLSSYQVKAF